LGREHPGNEAASTEGGSARTFSAEGLGTGSGEKHRRLNLESKAAIIEIQERNKSERKEMNRSAFHLPEDKATHDEGDSAQHITGLPSVHA